MKSKNNQRILVITSVMCLLPVLLSLALYRRLPEQIAIHWNSAGVADNFIPKALAAFGLPVLFVAINIYSKIRLYNDPKYVNDNDSPYAQILFLSAWLIPLLSIVLVPVTLLISLGIDIPITLMTSVGLGVILVLIGNYLPKCHPNHIVGIKLPWTLCDVDNWNKTHCMAGYLWMAGGFIIVATSLFFINQTIWGISVITLIVIFLVAVPILYSYVLYRKMKA